MKNTLTNKNIAFAILVAALGYLVDAYDIVIFSIVRVPSLQSLGLTGEAITTSGAFLLNIQLNGMLLGGLAWGVLGDKLGRLQVLFGSITLYSLASFANAYVGSVDQYALCRFFGGFGLAGEIGAGITLVSELMSKEKRGYGTMIIACAGLSGVSIAGFMGDHFAWKTVFIIGGVMGIGLLILRLSVPESNLFHTTRAQENIRRGDLRLLFMGSKERLKRYLCCALASSAMWLYLTLFVTFAPEIGRSLDILDPVKSGKALFYGGVGFALGCLLVGLISQKLHNRKKVLYVGLISYCLVGLFLLNGMTTTPQIYYYLMGLMGLCGGYWSVFLTMLAEQFGTNLRATVTTSIPNFMRGFGILHTASFIALKSIIGTIHAVEIIFVSFTLIALIALSFLRETFGIDLNFIESNERRTDQ